MPADSCAFCRMTQQACLRLSSNPNVFESDALRLPKAGKAYDTLIDDERIRLENEPAESETSWRELTGGESFSAKIWNDAYLAAFAKQTKLQLVAQMKGWRASLRRCCSEAVGGIGKQAEPTERFPPGRVGREPSADGETGWWPRFRR